LRGAAVSSIASSPAGVVILGDDRATGALAAWTSSDGSGWVRNWLPAASFGGGTPDVLVGARFGYLALGWRTDQVPGALVEGIALPRSLWSSVDGIAWAPASTTGLPDGEIAALVSGPAGVAALITLDGSRSAVAVTTDGRTWQGAVLPVGAVPFSDGLVPTHEGFALIGSIEGHDPQGEVSDTPGAWRSPDGLSWTPDADLASQLAARGNGIDEWQLAPGGTVGWSSVGGSGPVLLTAAGLDETAAPDDASWPGLAAASPAGLVWILGVDVAATCVSAWQDVDDRWRPLEGTSPDPTCLDGATPNVFASAALPDGMVLVGRVGSSDDRAAWLVRDTGRPPTGAAADGGPSIPPATSIPDPLAIEIARPASCPAMPTTIGAVIDLEPAAAVGCFGDTTMSFRAWVRDPGEGYGGTCGSFTPDWIRECVLPDYLLTPGPPPPTDTFAEFHAMRSRGATGDLKGVGRWVRVEGHYDDPAAPTCRAGSSGSADGIEPAVPPGLIVAECRLVFVVTHIRTVK
jgi:hypothetical protein